MATSLACAPGAHLTPKALGWLQVACAAAALLAVGTLAAATAVAVPLKLESHALGAPLLLEIVDLPPAAGEAALAAALEAVREVAAVAEGEPAARFHEAAGTGPVLLPPPLPELLARAHDFCYWSEGRHGPLGGHLYALWGLRLPAPALPSPAQRAEAARQARCELLEIDQAAGTASMAAGSRMELWGFARGFAVDRAVAALVAAGSTNASATLGSVQRAVGEGPEGRGWPVRISVDRHLRPWLTGHRLTDQSLAVASAWGESAHAGGERFAPFVDQSTGLPASGVIATAAITELAVDAEGVAVTAFLAGNRLGSHMLGQLRPAPAVLWLLGSGEGEPLVMDFRWSAAGLRRHGGP